MISLDQVTVRFGSFELFTGISLVIGPRERVGLVGKNGAGKSTLLKLIVGIQSPTEGAVTLPRDFKLGYLPQHMKYHDTVTLFEETEKSFQEVTSLEKEIEALTVELSQRSDYETDSYHQLITMLSEKSDRYELLGGRQRKAEIEQTLTGLGFSRSDFNRHTSEFSGGWRMRIELAKILLQKPDALLLDEPTNHLDIESIQWLEDYLAGFTGSVVLISHDLTFLDRVTQRTTEISLGKLYDYRVPYSQFLQLRAERHEQQMAAYRNQQKMIADTEKFIERFRYKATKAVQVQSRIKQLARLERIEIDEIDGSSIHIQFPPAPHSGKIVLEIENVSKSFDKLQVLDQVDLTLLRGEKVAFVGKNGEGKTTLTRIITGDITCRGKCRIGHQVKIGYYAQNQADLLDPQKTILETVDYIASGEVRSRIRDILGAFLFSGDEVDKKVSVLSGGERARLALACMLMEPKNLLILDEPTNHLDLRSKQILKEALIRFDGTLILVSHDRDFLDELVSRIFEFTNRHIKEHPGDIFEFLNKKRPDVLQRSKRRQRSQKDPGKTIVSKPGKESYEARKTREKLQRKKANRIKKIEDKIQHYEEELKKLEELLSDPEQLRAGQNPDPFTTYQQLQKKLDQAMKEWEQALL
ncbi:MAG: ABC-F family ATP-binding cassette domain-containing protein [Bacteroidales bacterium]|nr:ABC-F family ATP-binding cassette domain-containing protein [Bacteroidales bacterium]